MTNEWVPMGSDAWMDGIDPELVRAVIASGFARLSDDDLDERLAAVDRGEAPPGTTMLREGDWLIFRYGNRVLCRCPLASLLARQPGLS